MSAFPTPCEDVKGEMWWAVQPVIRPVVPGGLGLKNPIDAFIAEKLAEKGLAFSPEADRRTLLRRLSFDLLGLPPSPEEVVAFANDVQPDAYGRLVDRLLASPHYGERWARHWLDIAHYADTHGFERDQLRPHAWRYRDYVVEALNADKPYDVFLREQIAGDVLDPERPETVIATGFLAAGPWDFVGQIETKSEMLRRAARADDLDDMVTQVMTATVAMTVNCARCHDHKLDPIPTREYYALTSVFAGVKRGDREISAVAARDYAARLAPWQRERAELDSAITGLSGEIPPPVEAERAEKMEQLKAQRKKVEERIKHEPSPAQVYAIKPETPPTVRVLKRGNPETPGAEVTPGTLSWVQALPANLGTNNLPEGERRLALARWITDPRHPLTRRVLVNRLWHYHFGQGLVATPSDFGAGGEKPSHPELLDWLAEEFLASGWSLKAMHRLIVTSATYRQSSRSDPRAIALDAQNRWLWRVNPRRLDAESLRDAVLAVSGQLNPQMGGPGYRDFDYTEAYAPIYRAKTADTPELWRRSIYRFVVRTTPQQFLTTLDCPNPANLTPVRATTTTALQALALLNNEFMLQQAGYFAARVEREAGTEPTAQVHRALELAFVRPPIEREAGTATKLVQMHGLLALCRALFNANEFVTLD